MPNETSEMPEGTDKQATRTARAKMTLNTVTISKYGDKEMRSFKFNPVYSQDPESENKKFWDASPSGELNLGVVNQQVWPIFEVGEEYYLDITHVPKEGHTS
jgi:hypothetical protein